MEQFDAALQFKELTPEETEMISALYDSKNQIQSTRIGPKGYIVTNEYKKYAADLYNMESKPGDIFVASYQRSGTTWVQELVWLIVNNLDYKTAEAVPLTERYSFPEQVCLYDDEMKQEAMRRAEDIEKVRRVIELLSTPPSKTLANMPSPRFVKTHLPMSILPPRLLDTAKVVYIARDPRDVIVSCYHHAKLLVLKKFKGAFKDMWQAFLKDTFVLTPYFEHVKEAWALRDHPNMLFLFYEDLSKDLPSTIRRVAEFLGKAELAPEQIERLCDHLSIDNFKNNKSVNFEHTRELGFLHSNETFIRKGTSGGWRNYFDEEMQIDTKLWIEDNLRDSDLRYPSIEV